jgi:23S rRNA pseudoU1915 N3-methylase RlmH
MDKEPGNEEMISRLKAIQETIGGSTRAPVIPLIDPTANVIELFKAGEKRADDLREIGNKLRDAEFKRIDNLREMESKCAAEVDALREKLVGAESRRIDAVNLAESRRLDAGALEQKAAVTLAARDSTTTAQTLATQLTQLRESLEKRLQLLEQNQYLGGGAAAQRVESRGTSQWTIALIVTAVLGVGGFIIGIVGLGLHLTGH